jgi:hypothetical protein
MVTYRRIAMVIKTASKVGVFLHSCFVCCCLGGRWGNTEQVVTQWWHPEVSGVALDMLHQGIRAAMHPHVCMAIKMASKGGTFVPHCQFCL